MADMAEITQVEDCWEQLIAAGVTMEAYFIIGLISCNKLNFIKQ